MESEETMAPELAGQRFGGVVGEREGYVRVAAKAAAGEGEHVLREVDEREVRLGKGRAKHCGEEAGPGAELDDVQGVGGDELECGGVEGFVAGDQFHAVTVVGGGGGIEDGAAVVRGHEREHKHVLMKVAA